MGDSFVDVTYRGLEVGRRLRIRDFTSDAAYVEAPTPMPVGTPVDIAIDGGIVVKAIVARVHEQVGGSDRPPGMKVRASLDGAARAWWTDRAKELPAPPEPVRVVVPREETAPASPESGPVVVDDGKRTQVMPVIDPELSDGTPGELEDDGKRTQMMSTVEIEAIVAQATRAPSPSPEDSGEVEIEVSGGGADDEDVSQDGPSQDGPSTNGSNGTSKKKRRSRRNSRGGKR